jgi:hypothetical protein
MTEKQVLLRKILLKMQLIELLQAEVEEMKKQLSKKKAA